MQLAMTDSIKFVDMLHNVPWEDGLPNETRECEYRDTYVYVYAV